MPANKIKRDTNSVVFNPAFPIDTLRPASYNPRKITPEAQARLRESLKLLGCVKPIIVNGAKNLIIAGHQRTSQMRELGWKTAPVIILDNSSEGDEIHFNMYHNAVEEQMSDVTISGAETLNLKEYKYLPAANVKVIKHRNPVYTYEQGQLYTLFGNWGSCVIDEDGNIIHNPEWAIVCKTFNIPILCYKIKNEEVSFFKELLNADYGEYSFDHLNIKIDPAYQFKAQPQRAGKLSGSLLYENVVTSPRYCNITPGVQQIIDFGSGRCITPARYNKFGFDISMYEPFIRAKGSQLAIDISKTVSQISQLEMRLARTNKLFDVVVCEAVLNSVVNKTVEQYVMGTLNALCAIDGCLIISTRNITHEKKVLNASQVTESRRRRKVHFFTKDNVEVAFRRNDGKFRVQIFHSLESFREMLSYFFEEVFIWGKNNPYLYARCWKPKPLTEAIYKKVLVEEFNMQYPNDYRHNKHKKLVIKLLELLKIRDEEIAKNGYPASAEYTPPKIRKPSTSGKIRKRRARNDIRSPYTPQDKIRE